MVGGTPVSRARSGWDLVARRAALASGSRNSRHRANICDEPTDYRRQIADVYDLGRSVARAVLVIKHEVPGFVRMGWGGARRLHRTSEEANVAQ